MTGKMPIRDFSDNIIEEIPFEQNGKVLMFETQEDAKKSAVFMLGDNLENRSSHPLVDMRMKISHLTAENQYAIGGLDNLGYSLYFRYPKK